MQHTAETAKQYQCRHIFADGRRCSSPCLRGEEFCYYHHTTRKPIANPKQRRSRSSTFHLPLPEDRSAIQASIGEVLQRIAANDIDPRRAGLLLYGLQIASLNLPKPQPTQPVETVEEITLDPALGILAPRAEVSEPAQRKSSVALLIESMLRSDETAAAQEPAILPTLNAESATTSPHHHEDVISTGGGALAAAVEKSAFAFAVACSPQHHSKTKPVISTGGGRTQPPCRRSFVSRHTSHKSLANFHRLDPQSIATPKSKIPQHSHSLNLPQKLPVFSMRTTK